MPTTRTDLLTPFEAFIYARLKTAGFVSRERIYGAAYVSGLVRHVPGLTAERRRKSVDAVVSKLRRKIPEKIVPLYGEGYRLERSS